MRWCTVSTKLQLTHRVRLKIECTIKFQAQIEPVPDKGGAYVRFPYDIRKEFEKAE